SGIAVGSAATTPPITGPTSPPTITHAAIWNTSGAITDLGTLPGVTQSQATAINSAGDVVGWSGNFVGTIKPTAGQASLLLDLALGMNIGGVSVGENSSDYTSGDAFLYKASTQKMTDLGNLGGGFSMAQGINDSDDIVGMSLTSAGNYNAFFDNGSTMTDLN